MFVGIFILFNICKYLFLIYKILPSVQIFIDFCLFDYAYKGNKDKTQAVIIPLIITAVLSCVTEPMDFLFVFAGRMCYNCFRFLK